MGPTEFAALIDGVWDTWAPGILAVGGTIVAGGLAVFIATRFAKSTAIKIFQR